MPYLYHKSGTKEFVPDEHVAQALQSKKYGFPEGTKVPMVFPGGRVVPVSAGKVHKAYNLGLRLQTDEEAARSRLNMGETASTVAAGVAGLARGATFGLSDLALTQSGMVDPETLRDLRIAESDASIATEIVGAVAPALATKRLPGAAKLPTAKLSQFATSAGQRAANKVLGAVSKTGGENLVKKALRRGTEYGVAGALEGTVYSAGQGLTEYALGNEDNIAQAVVGHMGPGAVIGGGLGAAIGLPAGAFSAGIGKAAAKIGKRMEDLPGAIQKETEVQSAKKVAKSLGMDQKQIGNLQKWGKLEKGTDAMGTPGLAAVDDIKATGVDTIVDPNLTREANAQRVYNAREHWWQVIDGAYGQLDEMAGAAAIDRNAMANRVKELADKLKGKPGFKDTRNTYMGFVRELKQGKGPLSFQDAAASKRVLGEAWRDAEMARARGVIPRQVTETKKELERILDDEIKKRAKQVVDEAASAGVTGPGGEALNKNVLDNLLEANDNYSKIASYASALKRSKESPLGEIIGQVAGAGARGLAFGAVWGGGPLKALVRGVAYAGVPLARGVAKRLRPEVGAAMKHRQWAKLGKVQEMANKWQARISKTTKRIVEGRRPVYLAPTAVMLFGRGQEQKDKARAYAERLSASLRDPNELANRVAASMAGLEEVAPNIAAKVAGHTAHVYTTLEKLIPQPKIHSMLQPQFDAQPEWTDAETASFVRAATVAERPESVLDDLDAGRLNGHSATMLRLMYPDMYAAIATQVREEIGKMDKPLAGPRRQQIATFLGEPAGVTFTASFLRRQKSVWEQAGPQGKAPQGTSVRGIQSSNDAVERASTQTQQLETV